MSSHLCAAKLSPASTVTLIVCRKSLLHMPDCRLKPPPPCAQPWVESTVNASGHALGADADVPWLKVTPGALRGVLNWITNRYGPVELKVRWG
jgi:hypothetical protein